MKTSCFDWQQSIDLQSIGDELSKGQGIVCRVRQTNRRKVWSALRIAKLAPQPEKFGSKILKKVAAWNVPKIRIDPRPEKRGHCNRRQLLLLFVTTASKQIIVCMYYISHIHTYIHTYLPRTCIKHLPVARYTNKKAPNTQTHIRALEVKRN